jgi:serine/threonine-protein kinase
MSDRLEPGQIFAKRYRIERFIAKGGFGAVYAAEQVDTEARIALKIIWTHVVESDAALEQFKLEARLASRVGSDHVPRVFDVGRDAETEKPFLAMELLEGQHFEDLIRNEGPVPASTLVEYFRQIGHALDRAHGYLDKDGVNRPIVHRDLKPENLFLTARDGGAPLVKILDFGLAKMVGDSASLSRELKGTPLFMAFEQASVGPVTPQTDIWALGLIAFYMLTGRCYWVSANTPESPFTRLFTEVLSAPLEAPSVRAELLSAPVIPTPAFDAWFARCVNRDRNKRFLTAGECVRALAEALGNVPEITAADAGTTLPSLVPAALPTVRSVVPEMASEKVFLPTSSGERRQTFGRRTVSVVLGAMLTILAVAGLVAAQRSYAPAPVAASGPAAPAVNDPAPAPRKAETVSAVSVSIVTKDAGPLAATANGNPTATKAHAGHGAHTAKATPTAPALTASPPAAIAPAPLDPYDHR